MKKLIIVLFALVIMCGMNIPSFAQTSQVKSTKKAAVVNEVISGKIISIDTVKNEVMVQEDKTGTEKAIAVTSKAISTLKVGEEVKVTLNKGSNIAVKIKKLVKKTASTK